MKTSRRSKAATRKPVRAIRRHRTREIAGSAPATALVVRAPDAKPWLLNPEEVTILKNNVCKGATDAELQFCLTVARRYEFDPFQKQIWFVRRWDSEAMLADGKKGGYIWTPQVSIDGLCYQAASHHADYGSFSEVEYGPMVAVKYNDGRSTLQAPEWARIECWKKGAAQPTIGKVWWSEIYPDIDRAPLVRRMPRLMLGKCAKAQAIRAAYPKKTGGLLIPEETYSREFTDITPAGRIIEHPAAVNPHEQKYLERENEELSKLTPEQREYVMNKKREAEAKAEPVSPIVFYTWYDESDTARIEQPEKGVLPNELKLMLTQLVRQGVVAPNAEELKKLKVEFQKRGIELRQKAR